MNFDGEEKTDVYELIDVHVEGYVRGLDFCVFLR